MKPEICFANFLLINIAIASCETTPLSTQTQIKGEQKSYENEMEITGVAIPVPTDPCVSVPGVGGGGNGIFNMLTFDDGCELASDCSIKVETKYVGTLRFSLGNIGKNLTKGLSLTITALPNNLPNSPQNPSGIVTTNFYEGIFYEKKNYAIDYFLKFPQETFLHKNGGYQLAVNLTSDEGEGQIVRICRLFGIKLNADTGNDAAKTFFISGLALIVQQIFLIFIST